MTTVLVEQLGLFDEAVLAPPPPPPPEFVLPHNLLPMQDALAAAGDALGLIRLGNEWSRERYGHWPLVHRTASPHAWRIPGWGPSVPADLDVDECVGVLVTADLRCSCPVPSWRGSALPPKDGQCRCVGDGPLYRHACLGCGIVGPYRDDENGAAEDLVDHEWEGWEILPSAPSWAYEGSETGKPAAIAKWLTACSQLGYDREWLEEGGPVVTARSTRSGRHVPGRTPFGGYDMGRLA